jgi:hypothetical protein
VSSSLLHFYSARVLHSLQLFIFPCKDRATQGA